MNDLSDQTAIEEKPTWGIKHSALLTYFLSAYLTFTALCYLWGYWGSFGIDILEYAAITDLLRLALTAAALSVVVVLILGAVVGLTGDWKDNKFAPSLKSMLALLMLVLACLIIIHLFNKKESIAKYISDMPIAGIVIQLIFSALLFLFFRAKWWVDYFRHKPKVWRAIFVCFYFMPPVMFYFGSVRAQDIISNDSAAYVDTNIYHHKKYLGIVNGYLFMMDSDNKSILIGQFDKVVPVKITPAD